MAKRKRAKGAGRKPKGEFHGMRNPLSIRITDALREKLDGACKGSGRSLTQEVTKRLDDSFGIKAEPDPLLRAIHILDRPSCALYRQGMENKSLDVSGIPGSGVLDPRKIGPRQENSCLPKWRSNWERKWVSHPTS